jgi:PAS domain S-box-containing protein
MDAPSGRSRYVLPLAYLIAGSVWVIGSDELLDVGASDDYAQWFATSKGILFVALSAALLFAAQAWPAQQQIDRDPARRGVWRAVLVFIVCAVGVGVFGYSLYQHQAEQVRQRAAASLRHSTDLTSREIELWVSERRAGLDYASTNPAVLRAVRGAIAGDVGMRRALEDTLDLIGHSDGFSGMEVSTFEGRVLARMGADIPLSPVLRTYVERARLSGNVVMSDLYVPPEAKDARPVFDMVVMLDDEAAGAAPKAVLIARVDPERFLYPALHVAEPSPLAPKYSLARRSQLGATVLLTNENLGNGPALRFIEVTGTTLGAQVVRGRKDVFEALDYRGVPMLATGRAVTGTPWFLVAKVDLAAVEAPLRRQAGIATLFAFAGLVVAGLLVALWWRSERFALAARLDAAEGRARLLREHFAVAGRFVHDMVLLVDAEDGRILEANDRALDAYGYSRAELFEKTIFDLQSDPGDRSTWHTEFVRITVAGSGNFRARHVRRDGTAFALEGSARKLNIGGRTCMQAIARDITERLEQDARMAAISAERDRLLERMQLQFERMASACMVVSPEGRILQVNPAFERTFDRVAGTVTGESIEAVMQLPRFREEALERLHELLSRPDQSYSGVHENLTASGRGIVCRWSAAALRSADGAVHGVIAMADDITELVRAERALRGSEGRYRALTEISPVGIFRADLSGAIVFLNSRAREITGVDEHDATQAWVRALHPADAFTVTSAWIGYLKSRGERQQNTEFRMVRPGGRAVWVLAQVTPEHDADGNLVGHIGTITDVTAMKEAQLELQQSHRLLEQRVRERTQELEAAKDAAEHSDRVKTAFLSTMSHELRTPLNSILGFTDVLLHELSGPLSEEQSRQLRIVRDSSQHLRALVEDVLDISRIEAGQIGLEYGEVHLPDLLGRRLESFGQEAARKGIELVFRTEGDVPRVRSDAKRLSQIVGNLLSNAVKFTDVGSVTLQLRTGAEGIEVTVEDTGVGIPAAALGEIFDPFVQVTRPGGKLRDGTGLGLAISRNLARALGGDVFVRSEPGRGSRFTLRLPVREALAA